MPHVTNIYSLPDQVDERLAALGLSMPMIDEVIRVSVAARNSATAHHPRTHGGLMAYGDSVRALRDEASTAGFRAINDGGLEMCVNDDRGIAILIGRGNGGTGKADQNSSTLYRRGARGRQVLESNQLMLFPGRNQAIVYRKTWMLLIRQDGDHVWAELSLAAAIGTDGKVALWDERIIFPPHELNGVDPVAASKPVEPTPEIDISIVPR
jgi:hypothetical protein